MKFATLILLAALVAPSAVFARQIIHEDGSISFDARPEPAQHSNGNRGGDALIMHQDGSTTIVSDNLILHPDGTTDIIVED